MDYALVQNEQEASRHTQYLENTKIQTPKIPFEKLFNNSMNFNSGNL